MKESVLTILDSARKAVENDDVQGIIHSISELKIDHRQTSPLETYASNLILGVIRKRVESDGKPLRVTRMGPYKEPVYDWYKIENGVLLRNCRVASWTSLGKLYDAYKFLKRL